MGVVGHAQGAVRRKRALTTWNEVQDERDGRGAFLLNPDARQGMMPLPVTSSHGRSNGQDHRHQQRSAPRIRARRHQPIGRHPTTRCRSWTASCPRNMRRWSGSQDGRFLFRDLGSLNGSFLRGERVSEHILHDTDETHVGIDLPYVPGEVGAGLVAAKGDNRPRLDRGVIRQKIQAPRRPGLPPEKEIFDVEALRRDYEKIASRMKLAADRPRVNLELCSSRSS